ncbi:hypothetical protein K438DRAFT_1622726, partial [Mycena galopus ATCC 62051]
VQELNPPIRRDTTVTYCTSQTSDGCEGNSCLGTYTGPPVCLAVPKTACFFTTANVRLCTGTACDGDCVNSIPCSLPTLNGGCVWPNTLSIEILS